MSAVVYGQGNLIETNILGRYFGEPNMVTMCFEVKPVNLFDFRIAQLGADISQLMTKMSVAGQQWHGIRFRRLVPHPVSEWQEFNWTPIPGIITGNGCPAQIATLFKLRTSLTAPAGRGRFYIPGLPYSYFANNAYNLNFFTAANGLKEELQDFLGFNGSDPRVWLCVRSKQTDPASFNRVHVVDYSNYPVVIRSRRPTFA